MSRMSITTNHTSRFVFRGPRLLGLVALMLLLPASNMAQQVLDLCGCAGDPTLQPFNAGNPATYPPGTTGCTSNCTTGTITIATPPDGVLKFSSFTATAPSPLVSRATPPTPPSRCSLPAMSCFAEVAVVTSWFSMEDRARREARQASRELERSAATVASVAPTDRPSVSTVRQLEAAAWDREAGLEDRKQLARPAGRSSAYRSCSRCSAVPAAAGAVASARLRTVWAGAAAEAAALS